jgi:hypothetical protein
MRRRHDDLHLCELALGHVDRTVRAYVRFNALQQAKASVILRVEPVDLLVLRGDALHRQPAGDWPIRMIGHG